MTEGDKFKNYSVVSGR